MACESMIDSLTHLVRCDEKDVDTIGNMSAKTNSGPTSSLRLRFRKLLVTILRHPQPL